MPEQPSHIGPETITNLNYGEQARDYPQNLKNFYDTLVGDMRFVPQEIHSGPVYHLKTSKGLEVRVVTYYRDSQNARYARGDYKKSRFSYLIATDTAGEMLGSRMMKSYYYAPGERQNTIETSGEIVTRFRNLGVSTVLDLANREMLQNEINQVGGRLRWGIINSNAKSLDRLKKPRPKIPGLSGEEGLSTDIKAEIPAKEIEQDRWQSNYGALGKFKAFNSTNPDEDDLEVYLQSGQPVQNLDRVDEVWLERDTESSFAETRIKNIKLIPEGEETSRQQTRTRELQELMQKMQTIVVQK